MQIYLQAAKSYWCFYFELDANNFSKLLYVNSTIKPRNVTER